MINNIVIDRSYTDLDTSSAEFKTLLSCYPHATIYNLNSSNPGQAAGLNCISLEELKKILNAEVNTYGHLINWLIFTSNTFVPVIDEGLDNAPLYYVGDHYSEHRGVLFGLSLSDLKNLATVMDSRGMQWFLKGLSAEKIRKFQTSQYQGAVAKLSNNEPAFIFGAQRLGRDVAKFLRTKGVKVEGFIDNDPNKRGSEIDGVKVVNINDVKKRDSLILIATTRHVYPISCQLRELGFTNFIPYQIMSLVDKSIFPEEIPFVNLEEDLSKNASQYISLYLKLQDDESRNVLSTLVEYRFTGETALVQEIYDAKKTHYFGDKMFDFSDSEIFVDAGGFDGGTTLDFVHEVGGKYKKVFYFEPDPKLLKPSQDRLKELKNINFVNKGLFDHCGEVYFDSTGNTAGTIAENGNTKIDVTTLDNLTEDPISFIKMDIEGAEHQALIGAQGHIRRSKPKLAISAYHINSDLWRLAKLIWKIEPAYKFRMRHYSSTGLETVIFANT